VATEIVYRAGPSSSDTVRIHNVMIESIVQEPIMDASKANPMALKTTLSAHGIIYASNKVEPADHERLGIRVVGDTLNSQGSGWASRLLASLSEPQGHFQMRINSTTVLEAAGKKIMRTTSVNRPSMDIDNGPKPSPRLLHFVNDKSARIQFNIEFVRPLDCGAGGGRTSPDILSLKMWQAETLDERWFTTRRYRGRLRVASPDVGVHSFKEWFIPPLTFGFKRYNYSAEESEDGLTLDFTFEDRQVAVYPPLPALKWTASHKIVFPQPHSALAESTVNVRVEGNPQESKSRLASLAYQILEMRLHLTRIFLFTNRNFVQHAEIGEDLHDTVAYASATIKHTDGSIWAGTAPQAGDEDQLTFAENPPLPIVNTFVAPFFTAGLRGIFRHVLYQDSCGPFDLYSRPMGPVIEFPPTEEIEEGDTKGDRKDVPGYEDELDYQVSMPFENRTEGTGYLRYDVTTTLRNKSGIAHLPVAAGASGVESVQIEMFRPMTLRDISLEAERVNEWPEIPGFETFTDLNGITTRPLRHEPVLNDPVLSADGRAVLYGIHFDGTYALDRAVRSGDQYPAGLAPMFKDLPAIAKGLPPTNQKRPNTPDYQAVV